jgi:hypothetical protein
MWWFKTLFLISLLNSVHTNIGSLICQNAAKQQIMSVLIHLEISSPYIFISKSCYKGAVTELLIDLYFRKYQSSVIYIDDLTELSQLRQFENNSGLWFDDNNLELLERSTKIGITAPWVVFTSNNDKEIKAMNLFKVDQMVYFSHNTTVFEYFNMGRHKIMNTIGTFDSDWNNWMANPKVLQDFYQRRANFFGVTLKAMTEEQLPFIILPTNLNKTVLTESEIPSAFEVSKSALF